MQQIHETMIEEVGNDVDAMELYDELIEVATHYSEMRAKWLLMEREEKMWYGENCWDMKRRMGITVRQLVILLVILCFEQYKCTMMFG